MRFRFFAYIARAGYSQYLPPSHLCIDSRPQGVRRTTWLNDVDADVESANIQCHWDRLSMEEGRQPYAVLTYHQYGNTNVLEQLTVRIMGSSLI